MQFMSSDAIDWQWMLKVPKPSLDVALWLSLDRMRQPGEPGDKLTHTWTAGGAEFFCGTGEAPVHPQITEVDCPECTNSPTNCQSCVNGRFLVWHSLLTDETRLQIIQELEEEVLAIQ